MAIPVILTAGRMDKFSREDARREGADGLLIKPFEASELLAMVEAEIERVTTPGFVPPAPRVREPKPEALPVAAVVEVEVDYTSAWLAATHGDEPMFVARADSGEAASAKPEAETLSHKNLQVEKEAPWL